MDEREIEEIIKSIPEAEPRSQLEPYRELILRLRRQGRPYRLIQALLEKKFGVKVAIMTIDPATVDSVLKWAGALQSRTDYLIVKNAVNNPSSFDVWEQAPRAEHFRTTLKPHVIEMEYHHPTVEFPARNHGLTVGRIAARQHEVAEFNQFTVVIRAQAYRRHMYAEFDRVKEILLP